LEARPPVAASDGTILTLLTMLHPKRGGKHTSETARLDIQPAEPRRSREAPGGLGRLARAESGRRVLVRPRHLLHEYHVERAGLQTRFAEPPPHAHPGCDVGTESRILTPENRRFDERGLRQRRCDRADGATLPLERMEGRGSEGSDSRRENHRGSRGSGALAGRRRTSVDYRITSSRGWCTGSS